MSPIFIKSLSFGKDNTEITNEENILEVDVDLTPEQAELNR